ncbi:MAG: hypothetical protein HQ513_15965 [Rhodospirillales bacterium]|nr:hypothetical protein [Rhodospirillales bacterium]
MPIKRLFLSRVETDFKPDLDIAAGPWCFVGSESLFPNWDDLPFPKAFSSPEEFHQGNLLTCRLANHLAWLQAEKMNALHGRTYSPSFWRDMQMVGLVYAAQLTWRAYRKIEKLVKQHRDTPLHVRVMGETPYWNFWKTNEFLRHAAFDPQFNYWLLSLIVKELAPPSWTLETAARETGADQIVVEGDRKEVAMKKRSPLRAYIGRLGFDHVEGTKFSRFVFIALINLLPKKPYIPKSFTADPDVFKIFTESFLKVLGTVIEHTAPQILFSGFTDLEREALTHKYYPGRLSVTHSVNVDESYQIINALAVENGERLIGNQHGGWVGTALTGTWSSEVDYTYEAYITWGWTHHQDFVVKALPLPSPKLSEIRDKHRFRNDDLVYVGTQMVIQNDRIDSRPSPTGWLAYRKMKCVFLEGLSEQPAAALLYRPYLRKQEALEDGSYLKKHFPHIRILEADLERAMLKCRLLVIDHPGTTFHRAMAANIPTVCFWDPKDWPMCRQAEPLFQTLRDNDMLFDDPQSAAGHINKIWNDVPGWWKGDKVQTARKNWTHLHARTSPIWWWHWLRAFCKLS